MRLQSPLLPAVLVIAPTPPDPEPAYALPVVLLPLVASCESRRPLPAPPVEHHCMQLATPVAGGGDGSTECGGIGDALHTGGKGDADGATQVGGDGDAVHEAGGSGVFAAGATVIATFWPSLQWPPIVQM